MVDLDLFYGKVKFGNLGISIGKPEDQWSCETLTWYLGQAQNKIWFKMAQSFLRKASFNFQM